ncbi:MAG: helix-turn-helix domain-containing protein [Erysipelotrichaceae bacterium]|nr:helix-turn-helix domain-containing protein [Erysipelotrichaceae bacterium]
MKPLNEIVAQNLVELRKKSGLTQQQLAENFSYSDKTVSKWELGYAIPSVEVLKSLADYYGVNVDYFLVEHQISAEVEKKNKSKVDNHGLIVGLMDAVILLIVTMVFVWSILNVGTEPYWQVFVWGASGCLLLTTVFIRRWWKNDKVSLLICGSLFIWVLITAFYLQFLTQNVWYIYFIGIPMQLIAFILFKMK